MMKFSILAIGSAILFVTISGHGVRAQQSEQIRMDEFCPVMQKRLQQQLSSPNVKRALKLKQEGNGTRQSRERLAYVDSIRRNLKMAKCGGS